MKTRREVLTTLASTAMAGSGLTFTAETVRAAERMGIICHAVHKAVTTTGAGGDLAGAWSDQNNVTIEWMTFGIEETNVRALKEASLDKGSADIVFLLDRYTGPQYAGLFEDLSEWQTKAPIPQFGEFPKGMLAAHTLNGKLTGIPFRHATQGFHYNTEYFSERGLSGPPRTVQEFIAYAEKLTYTRPNGQRVYGLVINMDDPAIPLDWIRAYGGDFITSDFKIVCDSEEAIRGVTMLCDLVKKGYMPKNVVTLKNEDTITYMQQGRAAMANQPFQRHVTFNDPKASKFVGKIAVTSLPLAVTGKPTPAKTSVWAMAIPRNAPNKERSWSLIRYLSLPENTVRAALNGNGPVRPSAYENPKVQEKVPWASAEKEALSTARLVVPGFANATKSMDIFVEEFGLALLGQKTPKEAMNDIKKRVTPLLPA